MFSEFPPVSTQEWENAIVKDLKGADYAKKLIWKTLEGFAVKSYYREEDTDKIVNLEENQLVIRQNRENNDWEIITDKKHNGINIDAYKLQDAGATIVKSLAVGLAMTKENIEKSLKSGLSIDEILSQLRINLAVDSNYFFEIAKLRAARLIFHKLLQQYSAKNTKVFIVAYTSSWNKTIYDAYNNVLRTTTEAMSAIIGGADAVKIASFDKFFKKENDFSSRIAENQQHILKEESHLDEVVDPAAGSYYIESITKEIADVAWKIFEEIEAKGGYNACKDSISDDIDQVSEGKLKDVSSRKKPILGVNIFPNINEEILQNIEVQSEQKRAAKEIEDLRLSNERKFLTQKRPVVFLLTYGNVGMRRARAGFAMNFLACAGFEIRDNNGFKSIEEGLAEANKTDADIIVFCSSDEEYLQVLDIQLNKKENTKFIIAGNMGENETKFTEHGIDLFIHVKTNLLETLRTL